MTDYFVDLHIHIGGTPTGKPVKITASKNLTLTNILAEAANRKGLDMIGIIDAHVPEVQLELENLIKLGKAKPLPNGGIAYQRVTLILGSEIELYDEHCKGPIHVLCYFPDLLTMRVFSEWYAERVKNVTLSSQRIYVNAQVLQQKVKELGGLFIPAHIFTPFKSLYGKGVSKSLTEVFEPKLVDAVELGLSSDTSMAEQIEELAPYTFLTNSDAHSLKKIAREYQQIRMKEPTYRELQLALQETEGRKVVANYGMNPQLGKYYRTVCAQCFEQRDSRAKRCEQCGFTQIVKGVSERIQEISIQTERPKRTRPPYIHHAPMEYLPSLGPKTYERLLSNLGTEMYILHEASKEELINASNEKIANLILKMREGTLSFQAGGGGKYGKVDHFK
ncbi:endonuclease Q family protein [Salirhabdus salicampi]|uniref:endonuclease Q family protein n=1 Tax=Salirhabdus salicampi TaxID=476102 RepID=UPI0020C2FD99|nr:endonuclease Q family protein [Salirhabdus salicampi]MCP8616774.1 endonuclease Q family protein [Salirhabdus salicampi]